ncbi:MAG: hypothetical protein KatS3mg108_0137 [Isosphaeraceae bacterium]|jgi:hypothetical protein|nr:MAG: hypothetical protein KatS3mg108_0137 [Isosphaeraceae bacterium]
MVPPPIVPGLWPMPFGFVNVFHAGSLGSDTDLRRGARLESV